jgi:hypothetical protein
LLLSEARLAVELLRALGVVEVSATSRIEIGADFQGSARRRSLSQRRMLRSSGLFRCLFALTVVCLPKGREAKRNGENRGLCFGCRFD